MRRHLLTLLLVAMWCGCCVAAQSHPTTSTSPTMSNLFNSGKSASSKGRIAPPDFAYPKTVIKTESKSLKKALAAGDDLAALRAIINLDIAETSVSADKVDSMLQVVTSSAGQFATPQGRSLAALLEASILMEVYRSSSYKFDAREMPLTPRPAEVQLWSGKQFKTRIAELADSALSNEAILSASPLNEYATVVDVSDASLPYYPTLYDFVASKAIELLRGCSSFHSVIPLARLCDMSVYLATPLFCAADPTANRILEIYASLLRLHAGNEAPLLNYDMDRIDFTARNVYSDTPDTEPKIRMVELYRALYERHADSPWSGDVLLRLAHLCQRPDYGWLLDKMESNLRNFHNYANYSELKHDAAELKKKAININMPSAVYPGKPLLLNVTGINMQQVALRVYDATALVESDIDVLVAKLKNTLPIARFSATLRPTGQPFEFSADTTIVFPRPGYYVVIPETGLDDSRRYARSVRCTRLNLTALTLENTEFVTTDAMSGSPVSADIYAHAYRQPKRLVGSTGVSGLLTRASLGSDHDFSVEKGNDKFAGSIYVAGGYGWRKASEPMSYSANIITDLAIYHPGDTIRFCAIASVSEGHGQSHPCSDMELRATLTDASGERVDTLTATTDTFGRISGEFAIPRHCLTGNFSIIVERAARTSRSDGPQGYADVMVSDYKLPDFMIEADPAHVGAPEKGDVTLTGRVITYSGFPLADTRVQLTLSSGSFGWFWRISNPVVFHTAEATTDASGRFSFMLPAELLAGSPCPAGMFEGRITATSSTGESREQSVSFTLSNPFRISLDIKQNINLDDNNGQIRLPLTITGPNGKDPHKQVHYELTDVTHRISAEGTLTPAAALADWSNVASGTYSLRLTPVGFEAETVDISPLTLYRPDDTAAPSPEVLWAPSGELTFDSAPTLLFATAPDTCHVLVTVWTADSVLEQKWLNLKSGMHRFTPSPLPADCNNATVTFVAIRDFRTNNVDVSLTRRSSQQRLVVHRRTFRDRIVPGTPETWSVSVALENAATGGRPARNSALIMNMYNKALDALRPYGVMSLRLNRPWSPSLNVSKSYFGSITEKYGDSPDFSYLKIVAPEWELYNRELYNAFSNIRIRGTMMYKMAAPMTGAVENTADAYDMESDEAPMALAESALTTVTNSKSEMVENKKADAFIGSGADNGGAAPKSEQTEFSYRQGEAPLAFFRPMLTTGDDGNLEFTFTVPNANATWVWNVLAYDNEMLFGTESAEALASKPVMVMPNLPRFVRLSDRARIDAMVINNSDTTQHIVTVVELFNPADGTIIASRTLSDTLAASASASASIDIDATFGPLVGYRIKSSTADFADGEQALIAVLPAADPVVESQTFYIAPDRKEFEMTLPEIPADAVTTLQFCENPLWMVVTALPGIADDSNMSTPADAARSIYGAAIADNLLRRYPAVAEALQEWKNDAGKEASILESMLSKNEDLKTVLLSATPWMISAKNDTERMTRLSLLFDPQNIRSVYRRATALLQKLATPSGGWRWISDTDEASEWATSSALSYFGHLYSLGYMPEDVDGLEDMVDRAVRYVDSETVADFKRYPTAGYSGYAFMRGNFTMVERSADVNKIFRTVTSDIIDGWKKYGLSQKAVGAIVLTREGHVSTAARIMASVDQFAETSPTKGMYWPSLADNWFMAYNDLGITALILEAYEATGASATKIDSIRQWLLLQKEARDWGDNASTSTVVADILRSSQRWLATAGPVTVRVNGREVEVSPVDAHSGSLRADISPMLPSEAKLQICRTTDAPSWGSVVTRFTELPELIESRGCDDLTIEKNLYCAKADTDGIGWETVAVGDTLSVGERVRVELVLHVGRQLDYVAIVDNRAACLEPVEQLPKPLWQEGLCFYRENRDAATNIFITRLPKGTYRLSYEMFVNNAGNFASGIATAQSQYAPQFAAHSAGRRLLVE